MEGLTAARLGELVAKNPQMYGALIAFLTTLGAGQRYLGPKDDWVESKRKKWLHKLDEFLHVTGTAALLPIFAEGFTSKNQYACSIVVDPEDIGADEKPEDVLERKLYGMGYHRNMLAALKYRKVDGVREWSEGSWVWRPSFLSPWQFHATVYNGSNPREFDLYVHKEPSNITKPFKHLTSNHLDVPAAKRKFHKQVKRASLTMNNDGPS